MKLTALQRRLLEDLVKNGTGSTWDFDVARPLKTNVPGYTRARNNLIGKGLLSDQYPYPISDAGREFLNTTVFSNSEPAPDRTKPGRPRGLPPEERERVAALILKRGWTYRDVTESFEISVGTVANIVKEARAK